MFYQKQLGGRAPPRQSVASALTAPAVRGSDSRPSTEAHVSLHRPSSSAATAVQSLGTISAPAPTARPPPPRTGAPAFKHPKTSPELALAVLRRARVAPLGKGNAGSVRGSDTRAVHEA